MSRSTSVPAIPVLTTLLALLAAAPSSAQLTIAAASELKPALEEVRRVYTERTGNPMRTVYATPAGVVDRASKGGIDAILAPAEWIDSARARGVAGLAPAPLVTSPMAAWARQGHPLPDPQLLYLLDTAFQQIVVSDPAQSPDGARVRPFLDALSADSAFRKRIAPLPDPSVAIDSILTGRADAAILPQSAFWSSPASGMGRQEILDSARVQPQRTMSMILAVAHERQENAKAFLAWALGPQGKGIWRRNGFLP